MHASLSAPTEPLAEPRGHACGHGCARAGGTISVVALSSTRASVPAATTSSTPASVPAPTPASVPAAHPRVGDLVGATRLFAFFVERVHQVEWRSISLRFVDSGADYTAHFPPDDEPVAHAPGRGHPDPALRPADGAALVRPVLGRMASPSDAFGPWGHVAALARVGGFADLRRSVRATPKLRAFGGP